MLLNIDASCLISEPSWLIILLTTATCPELFRSETNFSTIPNASFNSLVMIAILLVARASMMMRSLVSVERILQVSSSNALGSVNVTTILLFTIFISYFLVRQERFHKLWLRDNVIS